jgi:hypothetical protein
MSEESEAKGDEPAEAGSTRQPILKHAWATFNAQGGVVKIIIGSLSAALTAVLTTGLLNLPSSVAGADDNGSAAGSSSVSTASSTIVREPATTPAPTVASTTPPTLSTLPATTSSAPSEPIEIQDVRVRQLDDANMIEIAIAGGANATILNEIGIETRKPGLPCTGGSYYNFNVAAQGVQTAESPEGATFSLLQSEDTEGTTQISGFQSVGCGDTSSQVRLRPQLAIGVGEIVRLGISIPRDFIGQQDPAAAPEDLGELSDLELFSLIGRVGQQPGTLHVLIGTTDGECDLYFADLADPSLPQLSADELYTFNNPDVDPGLSC